MRGATQSPVGARVTLNGKPATVTGRLCSFAIVRTLDGSMAIEWAWPAVERIVANGGRFNTGEVVQ